MKPTYHLTPAQARTMLLAAQGLIHPPNTATKEDVLATIRQMNVLQIDTINIVNRSPYLVLWSRIGAFPLPWLTDLLAEGKIFEYWAHAACFLPMDDYALYRCLMLGDIGDPIPVDNGIGARAVGWLAENPEIVERVLRHVRTHRGTRSADFERTTEHEQGWWNWKEEKIALEHLFLAGELMIAKRENFQRVYDLRERIIGVWDDTQNPSREAVRREFVLRSVKALGVAHENWVADYFRIKKRGVPELLQQMAEEGALLPASVEGWAGKFYVHPDQQSVLEEVLADRIKATRTVLLSPFDPVIWDRARLQRMFNFEYQIEVYTPEPKRKYGYFTLPILYGDRLIGRLDPKAHRKEKRLEIKAIHLEPEVAVTDDLVSNLTATIQDFARWHGAEEIQIQTTTPKPLMKALKGVKPRGAEITYGKV